jgi:hypothetical protein
LHRGDKIRNKVKPLLVNIVQLTELSPDPLLLDDKAIIRIAPPKENDEDEEDNTANNEPGSFHNSLG